MSFALAIISIGIIVPLTAIILGIEATVARRGVIPPLIGLGIVGLIILTINALYNYWLFYSPKSTHM